MVHRGMVHRDISGGCSCWAGFREGVCIVGVWVMRVVCVCVSVLHEDIVVIHLCSLVINLSAVTS